MKKFLIASFLAMFIMAIPSSQAKTKIVKPVSSATPVVSISFDDGDATIYTNGFPQLKKYNLPATLYLSASFIGNDSWYMNWNQVKTLNQGGWEIASHGYTHPDLTQLTDTQIKAELQQSKDLLASHGYTATSFATPYGEYNSKVLNLIKTYYQSNRRAWDDDPANEGFNNLSTFDRYNLSALELSNTMSLNSIKKKIDRAVSEKKWLVLFLHSVVNTKPQEYQFKSSVLEQVAGYLSQLQSQGRLKVSTIQNVVGSK